jgi:hypothetical protein
VQDLAVRYGCCLVRGSEPMTYRSGSPSVPYQVSARCLRRCADSCALPFIEVPQDLTRGLMLAPGTDQKISCFI